MVIHNRSERHSDLHLDSVERLFISTLRLHRVGSNELEKHRPEAEEGKQPELMKWKLSTDSFLFLLSYLLLNFPNGEQHRLGGWLIMCLALLSKKGSDLKMENIFAETTLTFPMRTESFLPVRLNDNEEEVAWEKRSNFFKLSRNWSRDDKSRSCSVVCLKSFWARLARFTISNLVDFDGVKDSRGFLKL
jgi:hypothetical protein